MAVGKSSTAEHKEKERGKRHMKKLLTTTNFTKTDLFNVTSADTLQNHIGEVVAVSGFATGEDVDKEGELHTIAYLKTADGMLSTISATAIRSIEELEDVLADAEGGAVNIKISGRKSKQGRDFIVLSIVD